MQLNALCLTSSNKCIATSNKCLTSSNKKLVFPGCFTLTSPAMELEESDRLDYCEWNRRGGVEGENVSAGCERPAVWA